MDVSNTGRNYVVWCKIKIEKESVDNELF
jgi:hypothetical protein